MENALLASAMRWTSSLRATAALVRRIHKLARQPVRHGLLVALSRGIFSQRIARIASTGSNLAALDTWRHPRGGFLPQSRHSPTPGRRHEVRRRHGFDRVECAIKNALGDRFAVLHHHVDELGDRLVTELGIGNIVRFGTSRRLGISR